MDTPKLIVLSGFAGIGKSTIARRYADEHPLCMNLEGDRLIVTLGQWLTHEDKARELVFELSKAMVATHLAHGYDVVLPYLPTQPHHIGEFERIANEHNARFVEVTLTCNRQEAIQRLLARGTWGEEGTNPLTPADLPVIENLYDRMEAALQARPNTLHIPCIEHDFDGTYQQFLQAIAA